MKLSVSANNAVFMKKSKDDVSIYNVYKANLRGGSIKYDVDLSQTDCGCVAGAYLVNTSPECGQKEMTNGDPQCPSIDLMQANAYGFNLKAHPCVDGQCDAISMCDLTMRKDGVEKYGQDAYGPGGSLIDTKEIFNVWTEFVSDANDSLWKLRTTLTQNSR